MPKHGFSLTRIFPYVDRIGVRGNTGQRKPVFWSFIYVVFVIMSKGYVKPDWYPPSKPFSGIFESTEKELKRLSVQCCCEEKLFWKCLEKFHGALKIFQKSNSAADVFLGLSLKFIEQRFCWTTRLILKDLGKVSKNRKQK